MSKQSNANILWFLPTHGDGRYLGTSTGAREVNFNYLRQVGYGNRPCPEKIAINLERESNRILLCEELCPEADWAFIRSTPSPSRRRTVPQPQ